MVEWWHIVLGIVGAYALILWFCVALTHGGNKNRSIERGRFSAPDSNDKDG